LRSQDLQLFLGSGHVGSLSWKIRFIVSLTFGDWAMYHQLLPHVGWGSSWPRMVRLWLSFQRPCCVTGVILLMSVGQDMISF
jgi:hypothetical protein